MCRPETLQSYYVLKAFQNATKYVSRRQLNSEIEQLLKIDGYHRLADVGSQPLTNLITVAAREDSIEHDETGKFRLTEQGARQLLVLEEMVKLSDLAVA